MKSTTVVLSLGASSLALPLGLDAWYNSLFSRSTYETQGNIDGYDSFESIVTGTIGSAIPTGTGTATLPTGTEAHHHHHHHHPYPGELPAVTPLSINYNLAPTNAPSIEVVQIVEQYHSEAHYFPTGTAPCPTATGVWPTGTAAPTAGPTGGLTSGDEPYPPIEPEQEQQSVWDWMKSLFGGR